MKNKALKLGVLAVIPLLITGWLASLSPVAGQTTQSNAPRNVFSPAHSSISDAVSHFLSRQPKPVQPIAFVHKVHVETVQLACEDCHITVARGPVASIPDIRTCWNCHAGVLQDHPEIQKMKGYLDKGQDIPWQRVWGWVEEAHVRFNHGPHVRAGVECATCHGDVSQMTVATKTMEHTMEFCVRCHRENKAPDDCVTCHY